MSNMRAARIKNELNRLRNMPWGITITPASDMLDNLDVTMRGPADTPYCYGKFKITIKIPEAYPNEPPLVKFVTPVYHPNIDKAGRICMDLLKMPPQGSWSPAITIENLLVHIQSLLANPNPDDPLDVDIAQEYINDNEKFTLKARYMTTQYAMEDETKFRMARDLKYHGIDAILSYLQCDKGCQTDEDMGKFVVPSTSKAPATVTSKLSLKRTKKNSGICNYDTDTDGDPKVDTVAKVLKTASRGQINNDFEDKRYNEILNTYTQLRMSYKPLNEIEKPPSSEYTQNLRPSEIKLSYQPNTPSKKVFDFGNGKDVLDIVSSEYKKSKPEYKSHLVKDKSVKKVKGHYSMYADLKDFSNINVVEDVELASQKDNEYLRSSPVFLSSDEEM